MIFYRKLIIPSLLLSAALGFLGSRLTVDFTLKSIGISYILSGPLFHYFIYEVRNTKEYYFYYNLGLSRLSLWIVTFAFSILIGLVFILV